MAGPLGLREEAWGRGGGDAGMPDQKEEDLGYWTERGGPRSDPSPNMPSPKCLMAGPAPLPSVNPDPRNHNLVRSPKL